MNTFVKLSVQDIFPNIQHFRNSDGSICGSSPIGFGSDRISTNTTNSNSNFNSVMNNFMNDSINKQISNFENKFNEDKLNKNGNLSIEEEITNALDQKC